VVDAQGLRAAARTTQTRKATLSKRVSELEADSACRCWCERRDR
jgi:hypothetical protein